MKINQIISETTTSGSIATTETALGGTQSRGNPSIYGGKKVGTLFKGKKTSAPYANSINESADLSEAELQEDDIIMVPGQGRIKKTGFVKHDPDRAEHEGQTLKNSLHTIIRVATHLDKELSVRDNFPEWVSEKIGAVKSNMVTVMDYLISAKEMQTDPDDMEDIEEGSTWKDSKAWKSTVDDFDRILSKMERDTPAREKQHQQGVKQKIKTKPMAGPKGALPEGAKVDRMVKHIEKSEKKLGHSKKEAENIAWATANKRGMLDNKNKKA